LREKNLQEFRHGPRCPRPATADHAQLPVTGRRRCE
jgi:hypothetical protein